MIRLPRFRPMTLVLAALVLGLAPGSISAQRSWHIEEFHTDLEIETSGVTNVTETIRFRFNGDWNGIYRDLLLTAPAVYGRRDLLRCRAREHRR